MTIEPTPLADLVAVDIDATATPQPCAYCPTWRFEWVDLADDTTVLREWHLPECPEIRLAQALNLQEVDMTDTPPEEDVPDTEPEIAPVSEPDEPEPAIEPSSDAVPSGDDGDETLVSQGDPPSTAND